MKCLRTILSTFCILCKSRRWGGGAEWDREVYSYVTCKTLAPMLRKRGLEFPSAQHKRPCRPCAGRSSLISGASSSCSIIRRWLLIRRKSILCQRVYNWPQHMVTMSSLVIGSMCGMHANSLCNSAAIPLCWSGCALSYTAEKKFPGQSFILYPHGNWISPWERPVIRIEI